jgi:hypothetical protein
LTQEAKELPILISKKKLKHLPRMLIAEFNSVKEFKDLAAGTISS